MIAKWNKDLKKVVWHEKESQVEIDAPFVQDDTIPPTESLATAEGKVFDSMSQLKRHYKHNGYEMTGGDHLTGKGVLDFKFKSDLQDIRSDILEAKRKIEWGMAPVTEREREICHREEMRYKTFKKNH